MNNYALIPLLIVVSVVIDRVVTAAPPDPMIQVKTWDDLRAAPVAASGAFGRARLGVEAFEAPRWGGVLIYCLIELDQNSRLPERFDHDHVLGPLDCRIARKDSRTIKRAKLIAQTPSLPTGLREVLYTRAVMIDRPGEYVVQISQPDQPKAVAAAVVVGNDQPFHPWTTMSRSKPRIQAAGDPGDVVSQLSTHSRGIALPAHDGMVPIDWLAKNEQHPPDRLLPKLSPTNVSEQLRLKGNSQELIIESQQPMIVARPDWHMLARWWVNGKPFVPRQIRESLADENGRVVSGQRMRIQLDFDPADVGAEAGDKIGLQLLYLPGGWRVVNDSLAMLVPAHGGRNLPRLTNQIEFPAP
jgi:hypothetical protein